MSYITLADLRGLGQAPAAPVTPGQPSATVTQGITQIGGLLNQIQTILAAALAAEATGAPSMAPAAQPLFAQIASTAGTLYQDPSVQSGSPLGNAIQNLSVDAVVGTISTSSDIQGPIAKVSADLGAAQQALSGAPAAGLSTTAMVGIAVGVLALIGVIWYSNTQA